MNYECLSDYLARRYAPSDYPAIRAQAEDFARRRPFAGMRILEATPLYFNTSAKLLPLVAGGAEVVLSLVPGVPRDRRFVAWARELGFACEEAPTGGFDLVSDCIGLHAGLSPRLGFAELTHSGIGYYRDSARPCFNTDGGRIKRIEGALGTGDGLVRGLARFGQDVGPGQRWLLLGFGKIGSGVGIRLRTLGADVAVVEAAAVRGRLRGTPVGDFEWVDMADRDAVAAAARRATHIVTATSVAGVVGRSYPPRAFLEGQVLVNIGAEDEYGPEFAPEQVLNGKVAVNFALEEPTHLRYIETTFALQNEGLAWIATHPGACGVVAPPEEMEERLLAIVRREGAIAGELRLIGL